LTLYPHDVQGQARSLLQLGRFTEVISELPQVEWAIREAALIGGVSVDSAALLSDHAVRIANGEAESILASNNRLTADSRRGMLIALDRIDEAEAELQGKTNLTITLLRGRAAEALQDLRLNDHSWLAAAWCQWMDMHSQADSQAATWLARIVAVVPEIVGRNWFLVT